MFLFMYLYIYLSTDYIIHTDTECTRQLFRLDTKEMWPYTFYIFPQHDVEDLLFSWP